eukprot:285528-Amphidinium_carterae.1
MDANGAADILVLAVAGVSVFRNLGNGSFVSGGVTDHSEKNKKAPKRIVHKGFFPKTKFPNYQKCLKKQ